MRQKIVGSVSVLILVLVTLSPRAAFAEAPAEAVYLSIGTSLAAGSQADESGATTDNSEWSYTDQLYQRIKGRLAPALVHEKLGCNGETADTIRGGLNAFGQPSHCTYEAGSQLDQALAVIGEGNVVLVTVDLGANDLIHAQQVCGGDPACIVAQIGPIASKAGAVVGSLRTAGYTGPVLAMNYYNPQVAAGIGYFHGVVGQQAPNPALAAGSDQLAQAFNGALAYFYTLNGAEVVDVYSAFSAGDFGDDEPLNGTWDNIDVVCELSYICPSDPGVKANFHLNKKGYKVVAKAFLDALDTP